MSILKKNLNYIYINLPANLLRLEKKAKNKKKFDEKHLPTKDFFGLQKYPLNISKLKFIIHSVKS